MKDFSCEDFNNGFFSEFFNGWFADSPALAVIFFVPVVFFGFIALISILDEK